MAHTRRGNQRQHAIHHAETCAQNRDEGQLFAGDNARFCYADGRFDLYLFERQITGCLITHQHGNLADQRAEFLGACVFIAQKGKLVLDERMIGDCNVSQIQRPPNDFFLVAIIHPSREKDKSRQRATSFLPDELAGLVFSTPCLFWMIPAPLSLAQPAKAGLRILKSRFLQRINPSCAQSE